MILTVIMVVPLGGKIAIIYFFRVKVFHDSNTISVVNYFHIVE
jgi:hypothetical protein